MPPKGTVKTDRKDAEIKATVERAAAEALKRRAARLGISEAEVIRQILLPVLEVEP
jgi:DNA-binding Lrp family transcriptional regulator